MYQQGGAILGTPWFALMTLKTPIWMVAGINYSVDAGFVSTGGMTMAVVSALKQKLDLRKAACGWHCRLRAMLGLL